MVDKKRARCSTGSVEPARDRGPPPSAYAGDCAACGMARTCAACLCTALCGRCTATARCGSCRNVHSAAHRTAGKQKSSQRGRSIALASTLAASPDRLDLPRTKAGLTEYLRLVSSHTDELWCAAAAARLRVARATLASAFHDARNLTASGFGAAGG